jgi:murein L,D-transpeptidase YafK
MNISKTTAMIALIASIGLLPPYAIGDQGTAQKADRVVVEKSKARLYLIKDDEVFDSFHVTFGSNPKGHKEKEGDEKTPEGQYTLDYKNTASRYYKAIHISYPNETDREHARKLGTSPGGNIMIHGQRNGFGWLTPLAQLVNWTDGCIAVKDRDMDKIWDAIDSGTPIEIRP